jgi:hypothetical protein
MTGISSMLTMFAAVFVMCKAISVPGPRGCRASRRFFSLHSSIATQGLYLTTIELSQIKTGRHDEFNSRIFQKEDVDDRRSIFVPPKFPSLTFNGGFVPNSCKKCKYFMRDPENANGGNCFLYPKRFDMIPYNVTKDGLIHNNYHACHTVRRDEKKCGKMGRHFEAKW